MKKIPASIIVLVLAFSQISFAEDRIKIAVLEFLNDTDEETRWNNWDLQRNFTRQLEKTKKFKSIDNDQIAAISKKAEWDDERLPFDAEQEFRALGVRYLFYSSVKEWRFELVSGGKVGNSSNQHRFRSPVAYVEFAVTVVDLISGKPVDTFVVEASAIGEAPEGEDITLVNERDFRPVFEEASELAFRKAIRNLEARLHS